MKLFIGAALLAFFALGATACGDDDGVVPTGDAGAVTVDARTMPVSRVEGFIRSDTYAKLVLEIDIVPGMEPRSQVQSDVLAGLQPLLDKPGGITASHDGQLTSRGSDYAWTFGDLQVLATDNFNLAVPSDTTKIHVLFVDGHYSEDTAGGKILGIAWSNQHLVMFKQTIESICAGAAVPPLIRDRVCAGAELAIWTHEIGHVIGLVDNGLPMVANHKDADHGAHDSSDECVMYWAYDGNAVIDLVRDRILAGGDGSLGFDQACLDDIAAVRDAQ